MYPSVGVATHGVASCDSAGEGGGVSNHNPCESRCDLYLWWNCIGTSDTLHITNDLGYSTRDVFTAYGGLEYQSSF